MLYRARTTLWVDARLIETDETFTPDPAKNHKPGSGWEPIDDEAKAAFRAAGSPKAPSGVVELPVASTPVDWRAEAVKAGWQPPTPDAVTSGYAAAPPSAFAVAASAAASGRSTPATTPVDDGEI